MAKTDFEKRVAGSPDMGLPIDLLKIFTKGGAWGIMAFFVGLAFYTFYLVPMSNEHSKFIDTIIKGNTRAQEIASENRDTNKEIGTTLKQIRDELSEQTSQRKEAIIKMFDFAKEVRDDHPSMDRKLDLLLEK